MSEGASECSSEKPFEGTVVPTNVGFNKVPSIASNDGLSDGRRDGKSEIIIIIGDSVGAVAGSSVLATIGLCEREVEEPSIRSLFMGEVDGISIGILMSLWSDLQTALNSSSRMVSRCEVSVDTVDLLLPFRSILCLAESFSAVIVSSVSPIRIKDDKKKRKIMISWLLINYSSRWTLYCGRNSEL